MAGDLFAVNGRIVPAAEASISVLDLGFLRGIGAFETFRTYNGHPHALADHLHRIWESAESFGQKPFFDEAAVRRVVGEIHQRSGHAELRVNMVVTPGCHGDGVFGTTGEPTWVVIARDVHAPPETSYQQGVSAVTFQASRHLPTLKTTSYLSGRKGMELAAKSGAHEAFYVDDAGYVTEGVTSNILIRVGTRVMTPNVDCLPGITKAGVRPIAAQLGLTWYECRITRDDVYTADEVWITSAVREVLPIVRVDGHRIADGTVGEWGRKLRNSYREHCIASAKRDAGL
jgi:branched-subunit amino acid aminotransferase/4-amino-4-deoxychorismate lyase